MNQLIEKCTEFLSVGCSPPTNRLHQSFQFNKTKISGKLVNVPRNFCTLYKYNFRYVHGYEIKNNIGPYFDISKGVRQWDPLSPITFNSGKFDNFYFCRKIERFLQENLI